VDSLYANEYALQTVPSRGNIGDPGKFSPKYSIRAESKKQKAKSSHSATAVKRCQIFSTFSVSFASQLRRMVLIKSIKLRLSLEKLGRSFLPKPANFPHSLTSWGTTTIRSFLGHKAASRCFCIVQKNERYFYAPTEANNYIFSLKIIE
jgi:hypothetical protein